MTNLILKYYFLEESDRLRMEDDLFKLIGKDREEILNLDDYSLNHLHNRLVYDQ
jgi:hypothetical protein